MKTSETSYEIIDKKFPKSWIDIPCGGYLVMP